ncbi:MAG: Mbov_0395 family pilin-like conjugal transfer protein [Patescibacteria group bacterium]
MKKTAILKQVLIVFGMVAVLTLPSFLFVNIVRGQQGEIPSASDRVETVAPESGYADADETTMAELLGYAVNAFLGLLGIIFIILVLIGGAKYMTASGNEEKAKAGLTMIRHAIIGLIIVVGSYAIWYFVLANLIWAG